MQAFLPGPVTVVVERRSTLPDVLTAGRERVGVRVPAHDVAREFLRAVGRPVTATSANVSGRPDVADPADLDERIRDGVAVVVDCGDLSRDAEDVATPGTASTVVDPGSGVVHRRGANAPAIESWLADDGE